MEQGAPEPCLTFGQLCGQESPSQSCPPRPLGTCLLELTAGLGSTHLHWTKGHYVQFGQIGHSRGCSRETGPSARVTSPASAALFEDFGKTIQDGANARLLGSPGLVARIASP